MQIMIRAFKRMIKVSVIKTVFPKNLKKNDCHHTNKFLDAGLKVSMQYAVHFKLINSWLPVNALEL